MDGIICSGTWVLEGVLVFVLLNPRSKAPREASVIWETLLVASAPLTLKAPILAGVPGWLLELASTEDG